MPLKLAIITSDKREFDRDYANPKPGFGKAPEALLHGLASMRAVETHVISCQQQVVQAPQKLADNIWYHALHVPKIGWLRTGYQGCVRAVRQKLRQINPMVVHGQGTERECSLSAILSGFPNLLTIHGNMRALERLYRARPFTYLWFTARLEALAVRRTGGVICLTSHTRREVEAAARRTWILPNAVTPPFFHIQRQPELTPAILCVADILVHKNQLRLIEALTPLAARHSFRVKFAGGRVTGDPYFKEFQQRLSQLPWCEYTGFWRQEQLLAELARASLLVLPSLEDNCPLAVMEAMAAGVPVAASRAGGLPDLIEPDRTGLLFDPRSVEDMRAKLGALLASADDRKRLGEMGRRTALERFTPEVIAAAHCRIYEELLQA